MNRKELRGEVAERLASGMTKSSVFQALSSPSIKDRKLAYAIASYPSPRLCEANKIHIRVLVVFAYLQGVLGLLVGFFIGLEESRLGGLVFAVVVAAIALLFAHGFKKNNVGAYNAYLVLTISQFPRQLEGFATSPTIAVIGLVIALGVFAYVAYVRSKIFPDFTFMSLRKNQGKYVFSD